MTNPHSRDQWRTRLQSLVERNGGGDLNVYLQVTRGSLPYRDHRFPAAAVPTVFAMCQAASPTPSEWLAKGIKVITRDDIRWARCDIKSTALLGNVLLRQEAEDHGAQETLLLRDGMALEFSASSLHVAKDGVVHATPNSHRILPGITARAIRDLAHRGVFDLEESDIPETLLRSADEIWLSSSTREILPVTELDGVPVGAGQPGPLWRRVHDAFQTMKQDYVKSGHE